MLKIAVIASSTVLPLITVNFAQAATVTYDFDVLIDSGSLLNDTYSGFFSYNDSTLNGSGDEYLAIDNLKFNFLGTDYTEADDNSSFGAEAAFLDGDFLGLSFSTDVQFSFIPGFFDLSEAYFAYDIPSGVGTGNITYSLRPPQPPTSVSEPTSVFSLLALATMGSSYMFKNKKQLKN